MKKNFFHLFLKIFLIVLAGIVLIILSWYFFGDGLVFLLLKQNAAEDICHEECGAERLMLEQNLISLAEYRPWLKNKILKNILNQNQPGNYRVLLLETYQKISGEETSLPKEVLNLLSDSKTPSELKEGIIYRATNLEPSQELIEQWKNIAINENEGIEARRAAIKKIGDLENIGFASMLLDLVKNTKKGGIQFEAITEAQSITKNKELDQNLINKSKEIFSDQTIHSSIREHVLDIFAFSKNKDFAKSFILEVYNNSKNYDKFLRYHAAELLDYLETGNWFSRKEIYLKPDISNKEWNDYAEETAKIIF